MSAKIPEDKDVALVARHVAFIGEKGVNALERIERRLRSRGLSPEDKRDLALGRRVREKALWNLPRNADLEAALRSLVSIPSKKKRK